MAGITLPPLEYCTLKRAAEILECAASDLLNWAATGRIEVCVYLDYADADIWLPGNQDNNPEVYDYLKNAYGYIGPNSHIDVQESKDVGYFHDLARKDRQMHGAKLFLRHTRNQRYIRAYLSGLWSLFIIPLTLETRGYIEIPKYDPENIRVLKIRPADVSHFFITPFQLRSNSHLKITINDLYITRTQIENLLIASSLTDDYSSEKEIPVFHLENNRYSFSFNQDNHVYSMSTQNTKITNIHTHNETHHHESRSSQEEISPIEPQNLNSEASERFAIKREQYLQAAIYVAFSHEYKERFEKCFMDEKISTTKWCKLISDNSKELFATSRKITQGDASIKNLLDDCLRDVKSRTQHQNLSFLKRQKQKPPLI